MIRACEATFQCHFCTLTGFTGQLIPFHVSHHCPQKMATDPLLVYFSDHFCIGMHTSDLYLVQCSHLETKECSSIEHKFLYLILCGSKIVELQ